MNIFKLVGFFSFVFLFTVLLIFTLNTISKAKVFKKDKIVTVKETKINPTKQPTKEPDNKIPEYKILYETTKRYDGGIDYYVLINKVDLKSSAFKKDIKSMIDELVEKKGKKISIEFHDNKKSLEISYRQFGKMKGLPKTDEEKKIIERSFVASYSGDMEVGIFLNTLMYFPGAFKTSSEVGKYVEIISYNPR
jgi:Na+-transporting methylmalonyl-CoA/oxaloacetate decarboxylase gamma subunit